MQRRLIVIVGSSGVGKTSLARALQEAFLPQTWLHFSVDTIFNCLPPSVVQRADRHNDWSAVDSAAVVGGAYACVRTLLELGHRVILDAVILGEAGAQRMSRALEGFDPWLVELTCSWDEIERRTLARGDRTLAEARHGFENARGHVAAHHTIDSTAAGPEVLAAQLAASLSGRASAA